MWHLMNNGRRGTLFFRKQAGASEKVESIYVSRKHPDVDLSTLSLYLGIMIAVIKCMLWRYILFL